MTRTYLTFTYHSCVALDKMFVSTWYHSKLCCFSCWRKTNSYKTI